jgi:AraC-like DNA-binding protein
MTENLVVAAIAFALSQVALSILLLSSSKVWSIQERLFAALLVAISCYVLTPLVREEPWVGVVHSLQTAVPGLFWLFSASLFDDHFKLRRWQVGLVAATVVLPLVGRMLTGYDFFLRILPQGLEFILVSLTLIAVARYWREDLVEYRRKLRLWFCGLNGLYLFILLFLREVVFPETTWLASLEYLPAAVMLLATNAILLEYKASIFSPSLMPIEPFDNIENTKPDTQPARNEHSDIIDNLTQLIDKQHIYRQTGITIGSLAEQIGVQEYRLRRAINHGLGFRNFNDFLNKYRISEVAKRLADPEEKPLPVLTIALDAGFRSLSSFNKAFKETHHIPPSAYRRKMLEC